MNVMSIKNSETDFSKEISKKLSKEAISLTIMAEMTHIDAGV